MPETLEHFSPLVTCPMCGNPNDGLWVNYCRGIQPHEIEEGVDTSSCSHQIEGQHLVVRCKRCSYERNMATIRPGAQLALVSNVPGSGMDKNLPWGDIRGNVPEKRVLPEDDFADLFDDEDE